MHNVYSLREALETISFLWMSHLKLFWTVTPSNFMDVTQSSSTASRVFKDNGMSMSHSKKQIDMVWHCEEFGLTSLFLHQSDSSSRWFCMLDCSPCWTTSLRAKQNNWWMFCLMLRHCELGMRSALSCPNHQQRGAVEVVKVSHDHNDSPRHECFQQCDNYFRWSCSGMVSSEGNR